MTKQSIDNAVQSVINTAAESQPQPEIRIPDYVNYEGFISEDACNRLVRLNEACALTEYLLSAYGEVHLDKTVNAVQLGALLEYFNEDLRAIKKGIHATEGIFRAEEGDRGLEYIRNNR